ncbi:MAG: BolA/IbaG family iron-sulfur metabolism protein [Gammaproteobacteria bacterium]|nr:BolA/IbaG family iron-sulfur metabolism protein [Gammaproteobacteria bacterium]
MAGRAQRIEAAVTAALNPSFIQLEDESHKHSVPEGAESHFKLVCVSEAFAGLMPVRRHQKVYGELQSELDGGLHALALHLYTPEEWAMQQQAPASPDCKGGSKAG